MVGSQSRENVVHTVAHALVMGHLPTVTGCRNYSPATKKCILDS